MNHKKVLQIILNKPQNKILYSRLIKWDENKTILENCELLNIGIFFARMLVSKYRLKFSRDIFDIRTKNRVYDNKKSSEYIKKWDSNCSLEQNAERLGVSYCQAVQIKNNYGLSYTKEYKSGLRLKHNSVSRNETIRNSMKDLRDNKNMTLKQIGRVFGVTRERVRQILQ